MGRGGEMNQYLKFSAGAFFYVLLAIGVGLGWWAPETLLAAIYTGMGALGLLGSVHYGAKYLQYQPGTQEKTVGPTLPPKEG